MPGYVAQLVVHRPSRTGVVAFANAYGLRGTSIRAVGLEALTTVLDAEPVAAAAVAPAPRPDRRGRRAVRAAGGGWAASSRWPPTATDLVMTGRRSARAPWRFVREAPDRWRGAAGMNTGEILAVLRDRRRRGRAARHRHVRLQPRPRRHLA